MTTDEKLDLLINEVQGMKADMQDVKTDIQGMKNKIESLEQKQLQTQITLENTVNKCIQVMYEGYKLNAERLDKSDIESIKRQSDLSTMIAKTTSEKVDRLIEQMKQSA